MRQRRRVRVGWRGWQELARSRHPPSRFRGVAGERINNPVSNPAMGVPAYGVVQREHVKRMKADSGVQIIIIAFGGMNWL